MRIRLLIVDDHALLREGLRHLVGACPNLELVGESADGVNLLDLVRDARPDVVVLDVGLPGRNGITLTREMQSTFPQVAVLGLSMHGDQEIARAMLDAGARGYVLKEMAFEDLEQAIRQVHAGRTYLSESLREALREPTSPAARQGRLGILSPREREVLRLLASGHSMEETSRKLGIHSKTAWTHRGRIAAKLGTKSVPELTKLAIREGLTEL